MSEHQSLARPVDGSKWEQALYAFLVEKGNRSGSRPDGRELLPHALAILCRPDA